MKLRHNTTKNENDQKKSIINELSARFEKEPQKDLKDIRTVIKVDQPSQSEPQKNESTTKPTEIPTPKNEEEIPTIKKDLEEKKEYLKAIKDFDFRINDNKEKIQQIEQKVANLSQDLDDLVSLYEIVSDQMNPFVGLSRVTKDRIDALEHTTEEIKQLKTRLEQLEYTNGYTTKEKTIIPETTTDKTPPNPPHQQTPQTNPQQTLHTTDTKYTDQELDTILDESIRTLQPLKNIEQEIKDFIDEHT